MHKYIKKFLFFICSRRLLKNSVLQSFAIIGVVSSVFTIYNIQIFTQLQDWPIKLFYIFLVYLCILCLLIIIKFIFTLNKIELNIRGTQFLIKAGDIFKSSDWKVIAFNEFYDTNVDDVIIAKNSLNGKFLNNYVSDISDLINIINNEDNSHLKRYEKEHNGTKKVCYPLGYIKIYKDFMLLAFTHFNEQNEAYVSNAGYEQCLRNMWKEISRTYANKPVTLPLLGSGVTRFSDSSEKTNYSLLKCILCTYRTSSVKINQQITILLTKDTLETINLYDLKGE